MWMATAGAFPDALVSGPAVAATDGLLLLAGDGLDDAVVTTLEDLDVDRAIVLGGEAAFASAVATEVVDAVGSAG